MKISLIISFYKNIPALCWILDALSKQTHQNFEVIISEDDNCAETPLFIRQQISKYRFPIKHLSQAEDNGFRKNEMLNKSIKAAVGDILVFIDGDCIPHSKFLQSHSQHVSKNILCFGRRVMLDAATTKMVYDGMYSEYLNTYRLFFTESRRKKYACYLPFLTSFRDEGIWGCNVGILKEDILKINGFDEDYKTAGIGEDVDLEWRLQRVGVKFKSIRFEAIVYHLHHTENYSTIDVAVGSKQLEEKKKQGFYFCKNGLQKTQSV